MFECLHERILAARIQAALALGMFRGASLDGFVCVSFRRVGAEVVADGEVANFLVAVHLAHLDVFGVGAVGGDEDQVVVDVQFRKPEVRIAQTFQRRAECRMVADVGDRDLNVRDRPGSETRHRRRTDVFEPLCGVVERAAKSCDQLPRALGPSGVVRNNPLMPTSTDNASHAYLVRFRLWHCQL